MLPESTLMSMSLTSYRDFLHKHNREPSSSSNAKLVSRVGNRIAKAMANYLKEHRQTKRIKNYKWEFNLVRDKTVNAWCMPGGKVVVYTGILPVTMDETGLAVVLGHEISHAIARHGNERMSQQLLVAAGGVGLAVALSEKPKQTQDLFLMSYGVGSVLGTLAYSRKHEAEADRMGLVFMALAGYNPDKAVEFWQRMSKQGGAHIPRFLSTHPSDAKRIENLKKYLPEARILYNNSKKRP